MSNKIKFFIILYFFVILIFSVAKIYHINMGYFYDGFPLIISVLSIILLFLILSMFSNKEKNDNGKKYPPLLSIILIFGLMFTFFACKDKEEILSILESRNSIEADLEAFAKANKLSKTGKESSNIERRFNNIDDFKKAILDYRKDLSKKSYVKIEIVPTVKTQAMAGTKTARMSDSPPCGTPSTNYNVNAKVYDYDGSADLNINLTYGVNNNGQYTAPGIQPSQFGGTSDSFTSTTPQITVSPNGTINGTFNTTQTNNWTINFLLFSTNVNNTTITRWHFTYNPCLGGGGSAFVEYKMAD